MTQPDNPTPPATPAPPADPPAAKPEAVDETGAKLGFPAETPIAEMTDAQRASYWRNEAKKQQKKIPGNLADLQAAYEELQAIKNAGKPPEQKQTEEQVTKAVAAARKEAAESAAMASLRVILAERGKSDAELDDLLEYVSPGRFVTDDGRIDAAKVKKYAAQVVPAGSGNGSGQQNFGQGRFDNTQLDRRAAGKAEAARRFGAK